MKMEELNQKENYIKMLIAITQRRSNEHEGSDVLEASYNNYYSQMGVTLIPIPNNPQLVQQYFDRLNMTGIILSGGGIIYPPLYNGKINSSDEYFPERDSTEKALLDYAINKDIPILGICRGMQRINVYFGGSIIQSLTNEFHGALNHKETRHPIKLIDNSIIKNYQDDIAEVNSHHASGFDKLHLSSQLIPFAQAEDQTIEAFYHPKYAIAGIMWHPEREHVQLKLNTTLITMFLSRKLYWKKTIK